MFQLLLALTASAAAYDAGGRLELTTASLQLEQLLLPAVVGSIPAITLPAFNQTLLGLNLEMHDFKIAVVNDGTAAFNFVEGTGIQFDVKDIGINVTFDWSYSGMHPFKVADHGTGFGINTLRLKGVNTVGFADKHLQIGLDQFTNDLVVTDVEMHGTVGTLDPLANALAGLLKVPLADAINPLVEKAVTAFMNKGINWLLGKIGTSAIVPLLLPKPFNIAQIDFGIVGVTVGENSIALDTLSEVQNKVTKQKCGLAMPVIPPTPAVLLQRMNVVTFSPWFVESAWWTFANEGLMKIRIGPSHSKLDPIKLNTKTFKLAIPGLYRAYPNTDMELVINANDIKDPAVTFEGGELRAHIANELYFNVLPYSTSGLRGARGAGSSQDSIPAFAVKCFMNVTGNASVVTVDTKKHGAHLEVGMHLRALEFDSLELDYTKFGPALGSAFIPTIGKLLAQTSERFLTPLINKGLSHVTIPLPYLGPFVPANTELVEDHDVLAIATDFSGFNPSSQQQAVPTGAR